MNHSTLNRMLLARFPDLATLYAEEVAWQEGDDTGSHVVYSDVFTPYCEKCILTGDRSATEKALAFIEEILTLKDAYASEVICLSVIESLSHLFGERPHLIASMGVQSRLELQRHLSPD